ncbi:ABC transporter permease [Desulfosediminicola ganghwensis]|uniref:ABC transporter permease n=1 Tax=Desulfosediminicola ganghwensis TaxID=2569540 RepID=UPI001E400100|nr:ABC transporter permease [Desulfosediminicola ganghwensis]
MHLYDIIRFAFRAASGYPTRTLLMLLAMAIGVSSVVVLSTLGDGAKQYVLDQFSSLGTNLVIVLPGRSETVGGPPPLLGVTPRDLTVDDAMALTRSANIRYVAPVVFGSAPVSYSGLQRDTPILGSTSQLFFIRQLEMGRGRFLPEAEANRAAPVCVLGDSTKKELFGNKPAVGERIRIGDNRFRVIGVLAEQGESLGIDLGNVVMIPVASAQALFDTTSLFRIMVEANDREAIGRARDTIVRIMKERHDGEDDVTVITQDAVLATFDRIFTALTLTVTGIGAISIAVAGILIMNVMLIAVSQRRSEVGLLKAIGAPNSEIVILFLAEAAILSFIGAVAGLIVAAGAVWLIEYILPQFPLSIPPWSIAVAVAVAFTTGLIFGVLPALRAAHLDPVLALSRR